MRREDVDALINGFLSSDLFARIRAERRVRQELPFAYPLEPDGLGGRSLLVNGGNLCKPPAPAFLVSFTGWNGATQSSKVSATVHGCG